MRSRSLILMVSLSLVLIAKATSADSPLTAAFRVTSGVTVSGDGLFQAVAGTPVTFEAHAVGARLRYMWTFSDGAPVSGPQVSHIFSRGGIATLTLTVVDMVSNHMISSSLDLRVIAQASPAQGSGRQVITPTPAPPVGDVQSRPTEPVDAIAPEAIPSGLLASAVQDNDEARHGRVETFLRRHGLNSVADIATYNQNVFEFYGNQALTAALPCLCNHSSWTSLGPNNIAGRILSISPHPTTPGTFLVGAADGGVWQTTNTGSTWTRLNVCIPELAIGAVAYAPSNPSTIYAGTGEPVTGDAIPGIGLYRTTDGGNCWYQQSSLIDVDFFAISVNPTNELVLVAGTDDGGLRSTDGGATWTTVISPSTYGYVTSIVRHPTTPTTLYATTISYSANQNHVLKSTNDGATWSIIGSGLPVGTQSNFLERMTIAMSTSTPTTLYVSTTVTGVAHIYRSTDGGATWVDRPLGSFTNYLSQPAYSTALAVSATNANVVFAGGLYYIKSTDGGSTWTQVSTSTHVDAHDARYTGSTLVIASDGGIWTSTNDGSTSTAQNTGLVTLQFYSLVSDNSHRSRILGGTQDNGTVRRGDAGGTSWTLPAGGDGIQCAIDRDAPAVVYTTFQGGYVLRAFDGDASLPNFTIMDPLYTTTDNQWASFYTPLVMDPNTPSTLYVGTYRVWKTTNGMQSWTALPNLPTTNTIYAIAVAPGNSSIIVVATGLAIYRTTNGGTTWSAINAGLPTPAANVVTIDPVNPSIIYVGLPYTTPGHQLYWTTDAGATWTAIATGLPNFSAQSFLVDPGNTTSRFCGTDVGIYTSVNNGTWTANFPYNTDVEGISMLDDRTLLRVGTHGAGALEYSYVSSTNRQPVPTINGPSTLSVTRGSTMTFTGTTTDPDTGDTVTGVWVFPDTWQRTAVAGGATSVQHTFTSTGTFPLTIPVTLTAIDSHKARASAVVTVTIN